MHRLVVVKMLGIPAHNLKDMFASPPQVTLEDMDPFVSYMSNLPDNAEDVERTDSPASGQRAQCAQQ